MADGGGLNWLLKWFRGSGDTSSEPMTLEQALSYPPVWHCVGKISGAFAIMPLNVLQYGTDKRQKTVQEKHPAYKLTRWRPNAYQTPSQWKRQMMVHALMFGNGRSYIRRNGNTPVELIPLAPDRTVSCMDKGEKIHATIVKRDERLSLFEDMQQNPEKTVVFDDDEVWHLPGLSCDGIEGISLIEIARRSWGIGIGAEKQISKQQKKGYGGGLMLEAPVGAFRQAADAKEFLKDFRESHEGAEKAGTIGMLREGIKANVLQMNNNDAQFLESRRFQREDAALLFMLESILGDSANASYNSLAERNLGYRTNCLAPWITSQEEECDLKLLTESERMRGFYFKFNDGALLRTEKSATASFVSQLISARVINANEAREMFDMNPYEGGDSFVNPAIDKKEIDNGGGGASNQPNKAMARMFRKLISTEADRCVQHSSDENFIAWMDKFYTDWERKLADEIEAVDGEREIATEHCEESKRRLLEACECQPDQLAESIANCVSSWANRVQTIIERLENVTGQQQN
jgi:HK97 family phage portal protein